MNKLIHHTILVMTILVVTTTGCSTSPPTRLYVIEPMSFVDGPGGNTEITVVVGPITLPEHLNRKEILTHDQRYQVDVAEFDRWAEPLDHNIAAVLAENLSVLLVSDNVIAYPWDASHSVDYSVRIRVHSFGSDPGGDVVLSVSWMVHDAGNTLVRLNKARYSERRVGDDVVSTVAAMSRTIEHLSRDIAGALAVASADGQ